MTTEFGTSADDLLTGSAEADALFGGDGNDTLIGGAGDDQLFGGFGNDVAVFSGNRANFTLSDFGGFPDNQLYVTSTAQGRNLVNEVEILRFDDQDVFVPALLDDHGDTPDMAGEFFERGSGIDRQQSVAYGEIGFDGDRDLFTLALSGGTTYRIDFEGNNFDGAELLGVFEPDGDLIDGTTGEINSTFEFVAPSAGLYSFLVASNGSTPGQYRLDLDELRFLGDDGDNALRGTRGEDTFFPGGGEDTISGEGGIDTVVLDGDRAEFSIEFFRPYTFGATDPVSGSIDGVDPDRSKLLFDVEILRFNDQDVYVLDLIDDFGDKLDSAGNIVPNESPLANDGDLIAEGRIDVIGDTDLFSVTLQDGQTFAFEFQDDRRGEVSQRVALNGIEDPSGNQVQMRQFPSFSDTYTQPTYFRATQSGTYLFSFAGIGNGVGDYVVDFRLAGMSSTDAFDWIKNSPFDDDIDAGGGDDSIDVTLAGTDSVDGGAGTDGLQITAEDEITISATDDSAIKIASSGGSVTVTNVEDFQFSQIGNFTDLSLDIDQIEMILALLPGGAALEVNLLEEDLAAIAGGGGNDIHQGTWRDDVITDPGGANVIFAADGDDRVGLLAGNNVVDGGDGRDLIVGGFGKDDLSGGTGDDVILGDISTNLFGADTIRGSEGDDLLEGGGGRDVFIFRPFEDFNTIGKLNISYDTPSETTVVGPDFESGLDKILLEDFDFTTSEDALAKVTDVNGVATFFDSGTTVIFAGLTVADLSPDDFIFV